MPRGNLRKRGAPRNSPRGGPRSSGGHGAVRGGKRQYLLNSEQPKGFTLADEARSTAHGGSSWSQDSRLRSRPVNFVSSGAIDPLKMLEDSLQRRASETLNQLSQQDVHKHHFETPSDQDLTGNEVDEAEKVDEADAVATETANAVKDLTLEEVKEEEPASASRPWHSGDKGDVRTSSTEATPDLNGVRYPLRSDPWAALEDSQQDTNEIHEDTLGIHEDKAAPQIPPLFYFDTSRDSSRRKTESPVLNQPEATTSDVDADSSEEVILFKGRNQVRKQPSNFTRKMDKDKRPMSFDLEEIHAEIQVVEKSHSSSQKPASNGPVPRPIQNAQPATMTRKEKKRAKNDKKRGNGQTKRKKRHVPVSPPSGLTEEEDALIADYVENMRENGFGEDTMGRNSYVRRDIRGSDMGMDSGEEPADPIDKGDTLDSGSEAEAPSDVSRQGVTERRDKVSNEQILALSPATQEVEVDELLLSALAADECTSHRDEDGEAEGSPRINIEEEVQRARDCGFPDSLDLDDYDSEDPDGYDFMDWGGPVLKRKARRRKGAPPTFDVSDAELEAKLQASFKKDRKRKAEKKQEREALRAQGLLGHKVDPDDLRVKYQDGMALDQIAEELRSFMIGNQTSLTLPPMDNHARKVIHELANKFNIKSKSTGAGHQRRPTLYRTLRTFKYSQDAFDLAISRVGRKYFPRKDRVNNVGLQRKTGRQGGGHVDISYRDGEVVGGSAPELGEENKGRAMLEKMGWSSGTALGAMTNKGILQPVEQKVKRGKAGLG